VAETTGEIIHLAGPTIAFDGVVRQRCAWCGALIDEKVPARMAVATDPTASEEVNTEEAKRAVESRWEGFVAIYGGLRWTVEEPDDGKAPERSCMRLLPLEERAA
jgi:hypothetical protein